MITKLTMMYAAFAALLILYIGLYVQLKAARKETKKWREEANENYQLAIHLGRRGR